MNIRRVLAVAALAAAVLSVEAAASDFTLQSSTQPVASSISLSASPAVIAAGGSSALVAAVRDQFGAPMSGASVNFTLVAGQGAVNPAWGTTNASGQASSAYTAPGGFPGQSMSVSVKACLAYSANCATASITVNKK